MTDCKDEKSKTPRKEDLIGLWMSILVKSFSGSLKIWLYQGLLAFACLCAWSAAWFGIAYGTLIILHVPHGNINMSLPTNQWLVGIMLSSFFVGLWYIICSLLGGMIATALRQQRGETITIRDLFSVLKMGPKLFGASLLLLVICAIGYLFCLIPGIYFSCIFMLVFPFIVDQRLGVLQAFRRSAQLVQQNFFMFAVFGFILFLATNIANNLGIGLILSLPVNALALTVMYAHASRPALSLQGTVE